jgi:drug/metabolite transporter (DMT)-like permease
MIFLWISILCSTSIYLIFKIRNRFDASLPGLVMVNYLVAVILGLVLNPTPFNISDVLSASWLPIAALVGFLFVIMFLLIGWSSETAGMGITSIATRMSMVIPILFSMLLFGEMVTLSKVLKIVLTFLAVMLAIYHRPDRNLKPLIAFMPLILFIGSGSVDTLVKVAQHHFIPDNDLELFSSTLFAVSFISSLTLLFKRKNEQKLLGRGTIVLGILLGLVNFGSLYFLINALNRSGLDSSLVFGINNLSIVSLTLLIGNMFFREKLSKINWVGIFLSIICIVLLTTA